MKSTERLLYLYAVLFMVFLYGPILLAPLFSFNDSIFWSVSSTPPAPPLREKYGSGVPLGLLLAT